MAKRLTLQDKILIALCSHTYLTIRAVRLFVKTENSTLLYKALSDLKCMREIREYKRNDTVSKRTITYYSITAFGLLRLRKRGHLPPEAYTRTQNITSLVLGSVPAETLMRYISIADAEHMLYMVGIDTPRNYIDTSKITQGNTLARIFDGCSIPTSKSDYDFVSVSEAKKYVEEEEAKGGQLIGMLLRGAENIVIYNDAFGRKKESQWLYSLDRKILLSYYTQNSVVLAADRKKTAICMYPHFRDVVDTYNNARGRRTKGEPLGMGYDSYIIIPMTYEGTLNLKMYLKDSAGSWALKSTYKKVEGGFQNLFGYREGDKLIYNGVYLDSQKIWKLNNIKERFGDKYGNYKIICLPWQKEYYKALVPDAEIEII